MYEEFKEDLKAETQDHAKVKIPLWGKAIEELLTEKSDTETTLPLSWLQERTQIHFKTLHSIVYGRVRSPDNEKLVKIAEAFGVSFPELAARAMGQHPSSYYKYQYNDRCLLQYTQHGLKFEIFTPPGSTARDLSMGKMYIKSMKDLTKWRFKNNSKICFHVYQGIIEFSYLSKKHIIKANEGFYFDAGFPHKFRNLDSKEAVLYIAAYPTFY